MTPDPALDGVIRQTQHLLIAFDSAIRSVDEGKPADSTTLTAPHIHEVLAACHESGRSAAVISTNPSAEVRAYLDTHNLLTQVTVVTASIGEAASTFDAPPVDCLLITSSAADIHAAQAAGISSIGYARTPDNAAHLVDAGAIAFVYSMADLALRLRAHAVKWGQ
jgi:beta-phosphoglucomutase-like phosphatase (HAD superfamily)